jgi:hypothetical protein
MMYDRLKTSKSLVTIDSNFKKRRPAREFGHELCYAQAE